MITFASNSAHRRYNTKSIKLISNFSAQGQENSSCSKIACCWKMASSTRSPISLLNLHLTNYLPEAESLSRSWQSLIWSRIHHWTPPWVYERGPHSYTRIFLRNTLILSSHLRLVLPDGLCNEVSHLKFYMNLSSSPCVLLALPM
jgi:hypothetical protein